MFLIRSFTVLCDTAFPANVRANAQLRCVYVHFTPNPYPRSNAAQFSRVSKFGGMMEFANNVDAVAVTAITKLLYCHQ